jgi:RNase P/RNase MRP subunit POP5
MLRLLTLIMPHRYISFFSYAFEALTANELEGLQLELGVEGFGSVNISKIDNILIILADRI